MPIIFAQQETIREGAFFWTSDQVIPELLTVPLAQKTTNALIRLRVRRVYRRNLGLVASKVHFLVLGSDPLLEEASLNVYGAGASLEKLVSAKVRDLVADCGVGQ